MRTGSKKINLSIKTTGEKLQKKDNIIQKRFDGLFNYSPDIIFRVTPEGKILEANQSAQCIFGPSIQGSNIKRFFVEKDLISEAMSNPYIVHSLRISPRLKNKANYVFKLTIIPLSEDEKIVEHLFLGRNLGEIITYQKQIENLKRKIEELAISKEKEFFEEKGQISLSVALKKLERANQKLEEINTNLNKELELAAMMQKSLIPTKSHDSEYLKFTFHFEPMGHVGGDYYDVIDLEGGKKGLILADVSGHGVSSALIAAMLKISFMNYAPYLHSPSNVLTRLNADYCSLIQTGDYVTAFYAIFDPEKGVVSYSGAGHPYPLLLHKKSNMVEQLHSEGFFLGMFEGSKYHDRKTEFISGDRFLVYTDGIVEAYSEDRNEQYGNQRLLVSFKHFHDGSGEELLDMIIKDVKKFMHKSKFYDDLAMVVVDHI